MTGRRRFVRRLAGGTAAAALVGLAFAGVHGAPMSAASRSTPGSAAWTDGSQGQAQAQKKPAKKDPAVKLEEPWPDAKRLAERRVEAENLLLFKNAEPLAFTLTADFGAINRDRDPNSSRRFAGVLQPQGEGDSARSVPVQISARGHARRDRRMCAVVPLRLEFTKADVAGTVLEGQRELKLVTHCENDDDYEQYVLTEYLAYRIIGLLTPRSFRARLAKVTYVDPARNRPPAARYGILIEHDGDMARRLEGRLYPLPNRLFSLLNQESLTLMALLQFMIGNTDYSIMAQHNVKLVLNPDGAIHPVTYDFDYSGLVNAPYAVVDQRLNLASVRDRMYRGPCRKLDEFDPFLAMIAARKNEVMELIDGVPDLRPARRQNIREYLNEFFSLTGSPARARRALVDSCRRLVGM
jgi:hypothetical protein